MLAPARSVSLACVAVLLFAAVASAGTFNVIFDNSLCCGPLAVVGTGTFSFTGSLGDGTYYLNTLPGYDINFMIGSSTFTNADINTPIADVLVVIYGGGAQFYFDNDGAYGSHGGSLDFDKADGSFLTTEPGYFGTPPLDLYAAGDSSESSYFGTYSQAPEPSYAAVLLVLGVAGAFSALKRRTAAWRLAGSMSLVAPVARWISRQS